MFNNRFAVIYLTLLGLSASTVGFAQDLQQIIVKHIEIVDEISRPVMAKLELVDSKDSETFLDNTDEQGIAEPNKPCPPGTRVRVYPMISQYLAQRRYPTCASKMRIILRLAGIASQMAKIGNAAIQDQKYGRATLVYTDAAYRLTTVDPITAAKFESKAYESASKIFPGIKFFAYDPKQQKEALTTDGVDAIKKYQQEHKLPVTGQIDVRTTQALAGESVFSQIRSAYEMTEKVQPDEGDFARFEMETGKNK